ncbi:MAG: hypothetical protein R3B57_09045 [Phycisphaerales bacterium]
MSPSTTTFEGEVGRALAEFQDALGVCATAVMGDGDWRPADLARRTGLDTKLAWKLHRILSSEAAMACGPYVPGRRGLSIMAEALAEAGAPREKVAELNEAAETFLSLVRRHGGSRRAFDALLAEHGESGAERSDLEQRRLAYEGSSYIWGVRAATNLATFIVAPSEEKDMLDIALIRAVYDLQRVRKKVSWRLARMFFQTPQKGVRKVERREAINPKRRGTPVTEELPLLDEFCTSPMPEYERIESAQGVVEYQLAEAEVGTQGSVTCVMGEVVRACQTRYSDDETPLRIRFGLRTPAELGVVDLLMHQDLFHRAAPRVKLMSDLFAGEAHSPYQVADELPTPERLEVLGADVRRAGLREAPEYVAMLERSLEWLGWEREAFDIYRFRMAYPPIPTTLMYIYDAALARRP